MRFTARFLILAITKAKAEFFAKQYKLDVREVEEVAKCDPSPTSAFTSWLCNAYRTDRDMTKIEALTEPLKAFMKMTNNPEFPKDKKDIGKYTPESLLKLTDSPRAYRRNLSQKGIEKLIMEEGVPGAELVWNARGFKMWKVSNPRYAQFLSSNTGWCTAQPGYSTDYCSKGHLYPVYFQNKPLAQGYQSQRDSSVAFLNKEDNPVSLSDPAIALMLESIQHPIMKAFEVKTLNEDRLDRLVDETVEGEITAKKLSLSSKNAQAIYFTTKALANKNDEWWIEGLEALLDYPALLKQLIFNHSVSMVSKIHQQDPNLAEEIVYELQANEFLTSDHMDRWLALGAEVPPEVLDSYIEELINSPKDFGGVKFVSDALNAKVLTFTPRTPRIDITTRRLETLFKGNPKNMDILPAALHIWKEIKHKNAWDIPQLKEQAEYQQRMAAIKTAVMKPIVGTEVTPGPDYEGNAAPGTKGTIIEVKKEGEDYAANVKWEDDSNEELIVSKEMGYYSLSRAAGAREPGWLPVKSHLKVGDHVIPSEHWEKQNIVPDGTIGIVTELTDGGDMAVVEWQDLPADRVERAQMGAFYTRRFKKVIPIETDAQGNKFNADGEQIDDTGRPTNKEPIIPATGPYTELNAGHDPISIGGAMRRILEVDNGCVYLSGGADLIARVLGGDENTEARHRYAEDVSGENSDRTKTSPELSPEGLAKLANALIAELGE